MYQEPALTQHEPIARNPRVVLLIFLSVFISSITFFNSPFEGYLHYIIFLILLPGFYSAFGFPKVPLQILSLPFIIGILEILAGNNTGALFFKIFIGVLLSSTFYFYVIKYFDDDAVTIFKLFLYGCYLTAVLGIIQVICFNLGIVPGYNYRWLLNKWSVVPGAIWGIRMNSLYPEASQCAIMLGPAAFVTIYNLIFRTDHFISRRKGIVILIALFLTTSSTGFIGLLFSMLLLAINFARFGTFLAFASVGLGMGFLLYNGIPEVQRRVDSAVGLWVNNDFSVENVNSSSFVLYNNFHIAFTNLKENPLMGTGLGSHAIAFDKYTLTKRAGILNITFNKFDANSLFLRLVSETGLIGITLAMMFIFRFHVRKSKDRSGKELWLISNALLVIILMYLIRQGNYFLNGFPLFVWLYYYVYLKSKSNEAESLTTEFTELNHQNENPLVRN